jgi:predicted TIM-barrel fold metal-dependent hydrolase
VQTAEGSSTVDAGDRRVVTALFADLVDYVRMLAEHDPEEVRARVGKALGRMGDAIERLGGTREKFIGDAVFAVFGWPQAHDDDAVRAALAALEIRALLLEPEDGGESETRARFAESSAQGFMANGRTMAEVICSGITHRFPILKIVSVESGAGWLPFFLEALDWQWRNNGAHLEHPDRELPSVYFHRQVFATYWFERSSLANCLVQLQDNLMFSTDFPHPTSQSPGPASDAVAPREYAHATLGAAPEEVARKVLQDNARRVFGLS